MGSALTTNTSNITNTNQLVNGAGFTVGSGVAKITVGTTEPTSPAVGDLWVDTN